MKRLLIILLAFVPMLTMAQDDMYFTPSKKKVQTQTQSYYSSSRPANYGGSTVTTVESAPVDNSIVDYGVSKRSDDEYNRRYADGSDNGSYSSSSSSDYDTEEIVSGDNSEIDYRYSRRLLRFHSPNVIVAVSSPYYWDLVYDYGVYDYLADYYYYDPFYYSWGWGYGWSWGYRWRPWNSWYGPIWGWSHPYHWSYWGVDLGWYHHGYYHNRYHYAHAGRGFAGHRYVTGARPYASGLNRGTNRVRTNSMAGSRAYANNGNQRFGSRTGFGGSRASGNGLGGGTSRSGYQMPYSGGRANGSGSRMQQSGGRSTYNNNSSSRRGSNDSYNRGNNSGRATSNYGRATSTPNNGSRSNSYSGGRSSSYGGGGGFSGGRSSGGGFGGGGRSGGGGFGGGGRASGGGRR